VKLVAAAFGRTGPGSVGLRCFLFGLVLAAGPVAAEVQSAPQADEQTAAGTSGEDAASNPGAPAPTRAPQTRSEIERALELVRREHEELVARIGDAEPTETQRARLQDVATLIRTLEEKLQTLQEVEEKKAAAAGDSFKGRWIRVRSALQDATRYDLKDGMFRFSLGVRLQLDATTAHEDAQLEADVGKISSSLKFRRARVFAEGRLFRTLDFRVEYDFAADQGFKDLYLDGARYTKYFKWRIGHFKEPFSLARQTSGYHLGFIEWALPVPTFSPGRNWGLMLRHPEVNQRLFWAFSATTAGKTTDDNRAEADISFTGRLTGLPVMRDEGRRLLHLGISTTRRDSSDGTTQFTARPEARFAPFFADTGSLDADTATVTALEFAGGFGPTWVQAEWFGNVTDSTQDGNLEFGGGYVEVGWFWTGERRFYVTEEAAFGRLTPTRLFRGENPFRKGSEGGALEFVGRASATDLNDGPVQGGELRNLSLGLNWYLSEVNRVSLDYVHSNLLDSGRANIVLLRFQYNP
jgi:phosphate-selective porin OprO/OprP